MAELQALAGGRADLLAEVAGIFEGTSEGEPDEALARSAARLCRLAGADLEAIPGWIREGRRRRDAARKAPPSGGVRGHQLGNPSSDIRCRVIRCFRGRPEDPADGGNHGHPRCPHQLAV